MTSRVLSLPPGSMSRSRKTRKRGPSNTTSEARIRALSVEDFGALPFRDLRVFLGRDFNFPVLFLVDLDWGALAFLGIVVCLSCVSGIKTSIRTCTRASIESSMASLDQPQLN